MIYPYLTLVSSLLFTLTPAIIYNYKYGQAYMEILYFFYPGGDYLMEYNNLFKRMHLTGREYPI